MKSRVRSIGIAASLFLSLSMSVAHAEKSSEFFPSYKEYNDDAKKILDKIEPQRGKIQLPDGVNLDLGDKFYFINKKDAAYILTEVWGNPPDSGTLGMVFPVKYDPLAQGLWGIELRMDKMGFVDDKDAASINYDDLLKSMQQDARDANSERVKSGYPSVELVGWATPPAYDSAHKRLHWAKELQFDGEAGRVLNYNVRFLGREGVFMMNYIAGMEKLPEVKENLEEVLNIAKVRGQLSA